MNTPAEPNGRRDALARWSSSTRAELERALADCGELPVVEDLRPPETGLVMARGRTGGTGAPFNVGDVAVSRATVRLGSGEIGFGHVLGGDREHARLCAVCDALWQLPGAHAPTLAALLEAIARRVADARGADAADAAATRVDFFTMTRGEDD